MTSPFRPQSPKLILRVDQTVASGVGDLIATSRTSDPPAPVVDAVLIEAHHAETLKDFRVTVREAGIPLWVDPMTVFWQGYTEPEFKWNGLKYGGTEPFDLNALEDEFIDDLAKLVVNTQVDAGATIILTPYLYADGPDTIEFRLTLKLIEATAKYMDAVGLRPGRQLVAVFAGNITGLGADSPRELAIARFSGALSRSGITSVATVVGPVDGKETAVKLMRMFRIHTDLASIAGVGSVYPLRQGLYGEALVALGMAGYETGVNTKEKNNLKSTIRARSKPRNPDAPSGSYQGLYVERFGQCIPLKKAKMLFENPAATGIIGCHDPSCCRNGVKSSQSNRIAHAVRSRSRTLNELSGIPQERWRLNYVQGKARDRYDAATTLNGILQAIDKERQTPYQVPTKGFAAVADVFERELQDKTSPPKAA